MHPARALPPPATGASGSSNPHELSDAALLDRVASSDPAATRAFVRRFQRRVYGLAFTVLGDAAAAEDVAQEALVRAWRHAGTYDARRGSVATWVLAITRNAAIDAARVRRPTTIDPDDLVVLSLASPERDPAEAAAVTDGVERLRDALTRLPDAQRRAVTLAGIGGLSASEVAAHEQIPLGTAKTRIRAALRRLRAELAPAPQRRERSDA
jgi:RNA polymerase sigma-70 factor (ECF subfamily)